MSLLSIGPIVKRITLTFVCSRYCDISAHIAVADGREDHEPGVCFRCTPALT
jgi:hypothetical protein